MKSVEAVLRAFEEGRPALLLTGRSPYDLMVDTQGKIRPLQESLRRALFDRYGMVFVRYSLANGLDWDSCRMADDRDRRTIEGAFKAHRLLGVSENQNEIVRVIQGISSLCRTSTAGLKWADGRDMRFAFLLEFAEHLTPGSLTNGTQTDSQLLSIELAHITAHSLALRSSGNLVLFHGREGLIDELVSSALYPIRLSQPDRDQKKIFLAAASELYNKAAFADGLDQDAVSHLSANTPNCGLEALLRASHRSGRAISADEIVVQKNRDVEELSEHTLTSLDTRRVQDLQLWGRNIHIVARILDFYADALLHGNSSMPANVLLAGPPGNGKTDCAIHTAWKAKAPAYQMHSPKGGIVGETERKARLQQTALREWVPNIAFADEITEMLPLERSDFDGDSGASRAVMAALLTALSDETRRGKSLLIGTTNCLWRMGAAMRSRFVVIPVLHPLKEDFPGILAATARRIAQTTQLDADDARVQEAARLFYDKGANPRHIRAALSNTLLLKGGLSEDTVLFAANDFVASTDLASAIYSDLWAVKCCSSKSYFPWSEDLSSYAFPPHLQGIVRSDGNIDRTELDKRLEEYRAGANV